MAPVLLQQRPMDLSGLWNMERVVGIDGFLLDSGVGVPLFPVSPRSPPAATISGVGCCDAGWAKRKMGAALLAAAKNPRRFEHRGPNAIKYTVRRKGEWVPKDIVVGPSDGETPHGAGDKWERWYWDDEGWLVSEAPSDELPEGFVRTRFGLTDPNAMEMRVSLVLARPTTNVMTRFFSRDVALAVREVPRFPDPEPQPDPEPEPEPEPLLERPQTAAPPPTPEPQPEPQPPAASPAAAPLASEQPRPNLSGRWELTQTTNADAFLASNGVPWLARRPVAAMLTRGKATVVIEQSDDDQKLGAANRSALLWTVSDGFGKRPCGRRLPLLKVAVVSGQVCECSKARTRCAQPPSALLPVHVLSGA